MTFVIIIIKYHEIFLVAFERAFSWRTGARFRSGDASQPSLRIREKPPFCFVVRGSVKRKLGE